MEAYIAVFVAESREQLAAMEAALLELESSPADAEILNAIFRAAHTIKGGAGVVECEYIVGFTHLVENVLDQLRSGELCADPELVALLLACSDHIAHLLDALETETGMNEALAGDGEALLAQLPCARLARQTIEPGPADGDPPSAWPESIEPSCGGTVEMGCWHISVRFGRDVLRKGMDPLAFLRYLTGLGRIVHLETLAEALPAAVEMDPESCYLGFEILFSSEADKAAIEQVFEFVQDDCQLSILPPHCRLDTYVALIRALPDDTMLLGEMLLQVGALTEAELAAALSAQRSTGTAESVAEAPKAAPIGEILVRQHAVEPELVAAALTKQKDANEKRSAESRLVRIPVDKLDRLIDLVGELVVAGAGAKLLALRSRLGDLVEATTETSRLVESVRDAALQLRMVRIGETFSRFNRLVRDCSRRLGKEIELVVSGGDIELDKSMVEMLGDPLMHLVRNAIDHGIELPVDRALQGKPRRGRVELNAYQDSGGVVVEVSDDGAGLDRERILAKAADRGLLRSGQQRSDPEVFELIFEAGFSTAEQVSEFSGRGVGMDVVKRNIQNLGGTIDIRSEPGQGARFAIRVPPTLASIDGFQVGVGRSS